MLPYIPELSRMFDEEYPLVAWLRMLRREQLAEETEGSIWRLPLTLVGWSKRAVVESDLTELHKHVDDCQQQLVDVQARSKEQWEEEWETREQDRMESQTQWIQRNVERHASRLTRIQDALTKVMERLDAGPLRDQAGEILLRALSEYGAWEPDVVEATAPMPKGWPKQEIRAAKEALARARRGLADQELRVCEAERIAEELNAISVKGRPA